jgi:hypothetical protein
MMAFGAFLIVLAALNLWIALRLGEFPTRWPLPEANRENPLWFWFNFAGTAGIGVFGAAMMLEGALSRVP